ncbi:hypothetical protein ACFFQW_02300 [Umezawaea endophytica]|uniref:GHMP kinase N-terminal domain-containing protein n=1 Tax=Umezawaea endophytica TaxID=1654476 RepID=A0A9X2VJ73_9PSEU|nr:hypothetical protein [Umezawaea endophytica]MCS7477082.1 hypothetical protein [Umezawaea endophytica]
MTDIADRPEVAPELRLVPHAFRQVFGRPAGGVWYAPGTVTLMAGHPRSLAVCARWGAIVAGERRDDGVLELASINRPAERASLWEGTVPPWAEPIAAVAEKIGVRGGATLLCSVDLPRGSGLAAATALACATALALRDLHRPDLSIEDLIAVVADSEPVFRGEAGRALGHDGDLVPFDLAESGRRLLVVDTRIRRGPPLPLVRATVLDDDLGRALTGYHRAQHRDPEQDAVVEAALAAGAHGACALVDEPGRPVVVLADASAVRPIRAAITAACSLAPRYLTVLPTGGAYRVD